MNLNQLQKFFKATDTIILNQTLILYTSLIELTRTVTWAPLFNTLLETVE